MVGINNDNDKWCKAWCKANMNSGESVHLKNVNTEVMEQIFLVKGFFPSLKYMNRLTYLFGLADMIDRHNIDII